MNINELNDTQLTIEIAKIDGWKAIKNDGFAGGYIAQHKSNFRYKGLGSSEDDAIWRNCLDYLTSRDTIISVIKKQSDDIIIKTIKNINCDYFDELQWWQVAKIFLCEPRQLCVALLTAVKGKE